MISGEERTQVSSQGSDDVRLADGTWQKSRATWEAELNERFRSPSPHITVHSVQVTNREIVVSRPNAKATFWQRTRATMFGNEEEMEVQIEWTLVHRGGRWFVTKETIRH
jgi:hypothetical protein